MQITSEQQDVIESIAREMGVPAESVDHLFAFIDGFKRTAGDDWSRAFPGVLIDKAQEGYPWAIDVAESMIGKALEGLGL